MICTDPTCACGIVSSSLTITGSGALADPYRLETNAYSIVTSTTRPASPFVGQFIWETNTQRQLVWTGAHWLIVGGAYPAWNLVRGSGDGPLSVPDYTMTVIPMANEIEDSDGFHVGSNGFVTIPAGYGGDYIINAATQWAGALGGYRQTIISISGNTTTASELTAPSAYAISDSMNNVAKRSRLEAGAVLTFNCWQNVGTPLNLNSVWFTGTMVRHIPTLV